MHKEVLCIAPTRSRKRGGSHRSDSRKCLTQPTRKGTPSKGNLKIFHQAIDRENRALLRAKATKIRELAVEGSAE